MGLNKMVFLNDLNLFENSMRVHESEIVHWLNNTTNTKAMEVKGLMCWTEDIKQAEAVVLVGPLSAITYELKTPAHSKISFSHGDLWTNSTSLSYFDTSCLAPFNLPLIHQCCLWKRPLYIHLRTKQPLHHSRYAQLFSWINILHHVLWFYTCLRFATYNQHVYVISSWIDIDLSLLSRKPVSLIVVNYHH